MKKIITISLIVALAGLFMGVILFLDGWIFTALFITFLLIVTNLIWTLLPLSIKRIFKNARKRFVGIVLVCLIFLSFSGAAMNRYWQWQPTPFGPIALLGNMVILVFTIFLGWSLIKPRKKGVLFIGVTLFILLISSITIIDSKTQRYVVAPTTEQLRSLPYLAWTPTEENIEKVGVTKNKRDLAYQGLNIYADFKGPMAYLMDISGKIVHTWSDGKSQWLHVEMCEDGDLLGVIEGRSLVRLDWNSNVKWVKRMRFHHDIAVTESKDIYALAKKDRAVFCHGLPIFINTDYIVLLTPDGKIKRKVSLYDILKEEIPPDIVTKMFRWSKNLISRGIILKVFGEKLLSFTSDEYYDIFHTNNIEIINRDIEGICKKGDLLICSPQLNFMGIVDIEKEKLIWSWGQGDLEGAHHPTLLQNGNILIFDNGHDRGYSRIVEVNPFTKDIVWEYKSNPPEKFHSSLAGSNQRLPNGNTLITESTKGHVFEVTPDGEIVWEFYNPEIKKEEKERRKIYRMKRIIDPENYAFLKDLE